MILIIDNYDSFTYNLVQLFQSRGQTVEVAYNDKISIQEIKDLNPDAILLSPGPGRPEDAGITLDLIKELNGHYPILGICLGHQAIGQAFEGTITKADHILHGKIDTIRHAANGLFNNIPSEFCATRYHSLVINQNSLSSELTITATAKSDGKIMAIQHKTAPTYGLQFHPESYASQYGQRIADNFISIAQKFKEAKDDSNTLS